MAPSDPTTRLAEHVKNRRLALNLARKRAAELAEMSKDTWQRIEEGGKVRLMSVAKVDAVLGWAPGSAVGILEGREPILTRTSPEAPGADISQRPTEDLDGRARELIQLATIATTSGLTSDEIRELSDRAVRDLKAHGVI
ncbi:helix-turn-helix domain-containing protein [Streptomyces sp. ME02-6979-3A]|uniref:helix-turn-helix domain-containing protein n=1 Tax=Streptomyces sp. ME02-6979-3A TaxID=3028673 RepID=UPI0029AFC109|nr:helix-turn-helix domain-containing protein [Streptomyces sp. ME02-6979-3A]MDX3328850.1 helix-turn-helix domain-containing protein [Streptomyces sp. ME02-6979-3A]